MIAMNKLSEGQRAMVTALNIQGAMRRRFIDLGLIEGIQIECVGKSPAGDPAAYAISGAVIAIRAQDAAGVSVKII